MQHAIKRRGIEAPISVQGGFQCILIADIGSPSTERARTMAGRQGRRFIHEKEFGVGVGLHHITMPAIEGQCADDPVGMTPACLAQALFGVVKNAAIAHEEPALGQSDDVALGGNAILSRHPLSQADFQRQRKNRVVDAMSSTHIGTMKCRRNAMAPEPLSAPTSHSRSEHTALIAPGAAGTSDHMRIKQAIDYLVDHAEDQPSLETMADLSGLSPHHFQRVFKRFAGISPKKFLQYLTLRHAKQALIDDASVLDAALDAGLSGPSRLHDLFVNCEAMTPGEFKALGTSLEIRYGVHDTAIGRVMLGVTERGICWLAFIADDGRPAEEEFAAAWRGATLIADQAATAHWVERAFTLDDADKKPLPLLVRGTNFQIKVWEALLRIPFGRLATYQDVAEAIGNPKAVRAVGSAVGKNNISWLIPCHRVILSSGVMHNYRWGVRQKKILNALEAGTASADAVGA